MKFRSSNELTSAKLDSYINAIHCFENKAIFKIPDELPSTIVAIGDIHGDLEALFTILLDANVINIDGKWIAHNTFLVQTGDIFDKGRINGEENQTTIIDINGNTKLLGKHEPFGKLGDEIIILKFLADLNHQAGDIQQFGNSRVLLCCGNHEIMNILEFLEDNYEHAIHAGYIHPMDTLLFGGPEYPKRRQLFTVRSGLLAKKLACMMNVVVVVGDFIFCHGGLNSNTLRDIHNIDDLDSINNMFREFLLGDYKNSVKLKTYIAAGMLQESITWFRKQGKDFDPKICQDTINTFMMSFKNQNYNLVIGHSIQTSCHDDDLISPTTFTKNRTNDDGTVDTCITLPNSICNNQIYRIDTAISRMNGAPNYQYPVSGRLNSLIIDLNPNGSKRLVIARNNKKGDIQLFPKP